MNMDILKFSYNWNGKLNNGVFTTLRLHNPNKYKVGNDYQIQLKGEAIAAAKLINKFVVKADQLTDYVCYLDTGYSKAETITILQRMYKHINLQDAKFDLCLLQKHKPERTKKG